MYERHFGLDELPFRLTPDPRFLFLSSQHRDVLAHLEVGLGDSSGLVCITGDVGTGKTTLLRRFLAGLPPGTPTAYLFNPILDPLEFLRAVSAEFGLPAASQSARALVDGLNHYLLTQRRGRGRGILVVDEAQGLTVEVLEQLRLLTNLETETEKLLCIVLAGQPQLAKLLARPDLVQLNQRITLRWHLGPLSREETAAYVQHRLRVAGAEQCKRLFTTAALELVYRYSGGVPRLINLICHRALLAAYACGGHRVTDRAVKRVHRELGSVPLPAPPAHRGGARVPERPARAALFGALGAGALALGVFAGASGWLGHAATRAGRWWRVRRPWLVGGGGGTEPARTSVATARDHRAAATAQEKQPVAIRAPVVRDIHGAGSLRALVRLGRVGSAIAAFDGMLARWNAPPLGLDERREPLDLDAVARARGLEHLRLEGSLGRIECLGLPAVFELLLPEANGPRYALVVGAGEGAAEIEVGGGRVQLTADVLERVWRGRAEVFWRDFEDLGPTLSRGARGPAVRRLQLMLEKAGEYRGGATGQFDELTERAVLAFQRSHGLFADARVGRLTRIALYAALGYEQPRLAEGSARR